MFDHKTLRYLVDRLRRQNIDILFPVLVAVAAGGIDGIDWVGTASLVVVGSTVTFLSWVAGAPVTNWWERVASTVAGAFLAVAGTTWAGWMDVQWWPAGVCAVLASAALSLLRSWVSVRSGE